MSFPRIIIGITFLLPFTTAVRAGPVTWEFAGEITFVRDDDNFLGGAVSVGTPFSGLFTFESTTPDSDPDEPRRGRYGDAITVISGQVGGLGFLNPAGAINFVEIKDGFSSPSLDSLLASSKVEFLTEPLDFSIILLDNTGTVFPNDFLPLSPPELDSFNRALFGIGDLSETIPLSLRGEVTSLVPEPGTLIFLGIGIFAVITRGRAHR